MFTFGVKDNNHHKGRSDSTWVKTSKLHLALLWFVNGHKLWHYPTESAMIHAHLLITCPPIVDPGYLSLSLLPPSPYLSLFLSYTPTLLSTNTLEYLE